MLCSMAGKVNGEKRLNRHGSRRWRTRYYHISSHDACCSSWCYVLYHAVYSALYVYVINICIQVQRYTSLLHHLSLHLHSCGCLFSFSSHCHVLYITLSLQITRFYLEAFACCFTLAGEAFLTFSVSCSSVFLCCATMGAKITATSVPTSFITIWLADCLSCLLSGLHILLFCVTSVGRKKQYYITTLVLSRHALRSIWYFCLVRAVRTLFIVVLPPGSPKAMIFCSPSNLPGWGV